MLIGAILGGVLGYILALLGLENTVIQYLNLANFGVYTHLFYYGFWIFGGGILGKVIEG